jgi:hypothetical protein
MSALREGRRGLLAAALLATSTGVVMTSSPASAQGEDQIAHGIELRKAHRDHEALEFFQRAVAERRVPRAVAQLGLCEHALGMWVEAEAHLQESLKATQDPWIAKNEATLRDDVMRVQTKLGSIEVWGTPTGADVNVDGHPVGALPLRGSIRVVTGRHAVTVAAPGFVSDSRSVEVTAGDLVREHFALGATSPSNNVAAPAARTPVPRTMPPMDPSAETERPLLSQHISLAADDASTAPEQSPGAGVEQEAAPYQRWWFWTGIGALVVGGALTAFLVLRSDERCPGLQGTTCVSW